MQEDEEKVYKFNMFLGSGSFMKEFSVKATSYEEAMNKAEEAMDKVIKEVAEASSMDEAYTKVSGAEFDTVEEE